jgi:hypothetical protein
MHVRAHPGFGFLLLCLGFFWLAGWAQCIAALPGFAGLECEPRKSSALSFLPMQNLPNLTIFVFFSDNSSPNLASLSLSSLLHLPASSLQRKHGPRHRRIPPYGSIPWPFWRNIL